MKSTENLQFYFQSCITIILYDNIRYKILTLTKVQRFELKEFVSTSKGDFHRSLSKFTNRFVAYLICKQTRL